MNYHKNTDWLYWKNVIEDQKLSGLPIIKYCKDNKIAYKEFNNMKYIIVYKRDSDPSAYKRHIELAKVYLQNSISKAEFLKNNPIKPCELRCVVTHMNALDKIAALENKAPSGGLFKPMKFLKVPIIPINNGGSPLPVEHEVCEKQNDIEIHITKGVKVSISPNIDSMKIIKIIELLKDL